MANSISSKLEAVWKRIVFPVKFLWFSLLSC